MSARPGLTIFKRELKTNAASGVYTGSEASLASRSGVPALQPGSPPQAPCLL